MRFSIAIAPKLPQDAAAEREHAQGWPVDDAPASYSLQPAAAPWPPGEPPDDLDQRVRQVGEW